ncbi:MAG: hypothetical protein C5B59_18745 [Bacteroidetes bacterium]|nr:MAG: hypothetical protein C5B59_18745 [Bacteroidota bacterium]
MRYGIFRGNKKLTGQIDNWSELCVNNQIISHHMQEKQTMEERLWDFIDGLSDAEEKSAIQKLIEENLEWKRAYHELLEAHQLLHQTDLEQPSMRFTRNVMEEIAKYKVAPATSTYINKKIIWGIGGFFLIMIVGFLIYGFSQINWTAASGNDPLSQVNVDKLNWSRFFSSTYTNIFMMINVILGLVLLDLYLHRKKEKAREEVS